MKLTVGLLEAGRAVVMFHCGGSCDWPRGNASLVEIGGDLGYRSDVLMTGALSRALSRADASSVCCS